MIDILPQITHQGDGTKVTPYYKIQSKFTPQVAERKKWIPRL